MLRNTFLLLFLLLSLFCSLCPLHAMMNEYVRIRKSHLFAGGEVFGVRCGTHDRLLITLLSVERREVCVTQIAYNEYGVFLVVLTLLSARPFPVSVSVPSELSVGIFPFNIGVCGDGIEAGAVDGTSSHTWWTTASHFPCERQPRVVGCSGVQVSAWFRSCIGECRRQQKILFSAIPSKRLKLHPSFVFFIPTQHYILFCFF